MKAYRFQENHWCNALYVRATENGIYAPAIALPSVRQI